MDNRADDYLLKPCESQEMIFRIKNCLEKQEMARKIALYHKILPICRVCQKIRDDSGQAPGPGEWVGIEAYIHKRAGLDMTPGYCPECERQTTAADAPDKRDGEPA